MAMAIMGVMSKITKPMKMMGKTMKTFGKKGVQKSMKQMGFMAKMMKEGIGGQMMDAMKGFLDIFKLFAPIFKPIGALIRVFIAEILIQLLPLMIPIMNNMMKLIPVMRMAGQAVGKWVILMGSMGIAIGILYKAGQRFIGNVLNRISSAFNYIKNIYNKTLGNVFSWIIKGFNKVKSGMKDIVNGIIKVIRSFISVINKVPGVDIDKPSYIHSGIKSVPSTGLYMLKRHEKVLDQDDASNIENGGIHIHIDMRDAIIDNRDKLVRDIVEQVVIQIG